MPNTITLRYVTGPTCPCLIIDHDGKQVSCERFEADVPTNVVKGIELTLRTLGYIPNLRKMYLDADLIVLEFNQCSPLS